MAPALLGSSSLTPLRGQEPIDRLQVSLMTMGPGASVYERFGHNAIWIRDTVTGRDLVYNYGTFDYREPGFIVRFIMGRPRYWLAEWGMESTIASYTHAQRSISVQELRLSPAQKIELASRLAENARPENRTYTYDYYLDNCSTRIRDMLDVILAGRLSEMTKGRPAEGTLRFHTQRSLTNNVAMYLGILAPMGPVVDRPLDQWGEMFLPAKVAERIAELQVTDADGVTQPLVMSTRSLLTFNAHHVESQRVDWSWRFLVIALLLCAVISTGFRSGHGGTVGRVAAGVWLIVLGLGGLVFLFLWLVTDHTATSWNRNLLLFSPFALSVVPLLRTRVRRRAARPFVTRAAVVVFAVSVVLGVVLSLSMRLGGQDMHEVAALTALPALASAALAYGISRRRDAALPPPR